MVLSGASLLFSHSQAINGRILKREEFNHAG